MARPQLRRLALSSLLSASSSSTGFDYVYLVPIVGGAALLAALALWLAARHGVCRRARSAAPATPPQRKEGDDNEGSRVSEAARFFDSGADYVSLATDSQRTASSLFTGSGRGFKRARASTGGSTGHDLALPEADAARLYALLQQSAARRVSFDKIAFGAPARRGANPARRVWLCQYEGEEMDVTQLVIVAPAAAAGGAAPRQDVTSPRSLQTSRGLSSSSSSVSAAALSPTTANNLPPSSELLPQLEQFVREIRLVASLRHPNIVPFVGVAWSALSTLSLVTDHVPHGDLRVVLKRSRRDPTFSWQTHKLRIALGVARSLVYLHHQSVHSNDPKTPHRPVLYQHLRASSVGLTADFEPLLLDFSAAAASDSKKLSTQETPEKLAAGRGDAFWLAPEVLSGANRATPAADVYAFGVLMSELDSGGKSPFHRELRSHDSATTLRPFQVLHRVASGELRPSLRPDCPPELRAIAHACLAQDPKDRPSAARVCELLLAAVSPVEGGGASFGGIV